jgi:hypothetical protein
MLALVQAMDLFPTEALASDLHPSAKGSNCRKILNREPDCLSGRGKTTTNESRTSPTLALCHEQFGWKVVVEGHGFGPEMSSACFFALLPGVTFVDHWSKQPHALENPRSTEEEHPLS